MKPYDIIVLTAANEAQAGGYRKQLEWRRENRLIPDKTQCFVFADPGGRRVGSLGSTFFVLAELSKLLHKKAEVSSFENLFKGLRILICHSGGDSRRTPAYTSQGKVFTPVPAVSENGAPLALFDLILHTLTGLPAPDDGHVLVTSGDVLLTFDHASVDFSRPGVTGVAYFGSSDRGSRHGVYVPSSFKGGSSRTECFPVADFLQKPNSVQMSAAGAIDAFGHVAIDTGLVSFGPATTQKLLDLCGVKLKRGGPFISNGILNDIISGKAPQMDIYEELLMALTPSFSEKNFVKRFAERQPGAAQKNRMQKFYKSVHDIGLSVNILPYCEFFHIGSSRELLSGFSGLSRTAQEYGFANGSGAVITDQDDNGRTFIFNSYLTSPFSSNRALLESVYIYGCDEVVLDGDNILTGVPASCSVKISLPAGVGLVCLPVGQKKWAAIAYGINDDFKSAFRGDRDCLFLNEAIDLWMSKNGVEPEKLWHGDDNNGMWSARLWRIGDINDVVSEAIAIASGKGFKRASSGACRYSISQLVFKVNHTRLLEERSEIRRRVGLLNVSRRLKDNNTLSSKVICDEIRSSEDAGTVLRQLADLINSVDSQQYIFKARVLKLASMIYQSWPDLGYGISKTVSDEKSALTAAFQQVSHSVALSCKPSEFRGSAAILHDQVVWVTTPVRIDFAGGWSDTPPICTELGGSVLNAAITLNGLYPVQVMAKLNNHNTIRLTSIDLGERLELTKTTQVLDHHDPTDWAALAKAALIQSGIVPDSPGVSLKKRLELFGGGLDLTIFSSLPKGSGMGTSSILGAAVLACLDRVLGVPFSTDRLIFMTSMLEQRMSTGGGWQDQVGGILPGVKLVRTEPGIDQTVNLRWSVFDMREESDLKKRCLLYFTGQKRMARNILQNVVGGYLARNQLILRTIDDLKVCAVETKEALDAQDIEAFASGVNRYWELKKQIDPGSTNKPIEKMLKMVENDCSAKLLPGAGGGGFIFIIAKNVEAAARIKEKFDKNPPNKHARFFDFDIDQQGLKVTVL